MLCKTSGTLLNTNNRGRSKTCPCILHGFAVLPTSFVLPLRGRTGGRPGVPPLQRHSYLERWLGTPGADAEPHQQKFLQNQGPVARREFRVPLRFCAPEVLHLQNRYASLVMGSGERRIWTRSVHPEPSPGAFWLLCRHGQSNPPSADGGIPLRTTNLFLTLSPHPSGLTASHLPPRGKALKRSSPSGFSPPRGKA